MDQFKKTRERIDARCVLQGERLRARGYVEEDQVRVEVCFRIQGEWLVAIDECAEIKFEWIPGTWWVNGGADRKISRLSRTFALGRLQGRGSGLCELVAGVSDV